MSWGGSNARFSPVPQQPGHFSGGRAMEDRAARPVTVGTKNHAYKGLLTEFNGVVLVIDTKGGRVTVPVASVKFVIPLPEGAKL